MTSMKRRTEFIDIEHRGFALTDIAHMPDSLLAAMVADDRVSEMWEDDCFVGMFFAEVQDAMANAWSRAKRESLAHLNRQMWNLNIERMLS